MNPLPGLPDEYLEYVSLFSGETAEDYARDIHHMLTKSDEELQEMGIRGARFLRENKTSTKIMKRVYDFVKD